MGSQTLLFRCDADASIGIGHVMRCVAIAEAWQAGEGRARFATADLPEGLEARLSVGGLELSRIPHMRGSREDAEATIREAHKSGANWVVIDGEGFGADFLQAVREARVSVLLIDDFAGREAYPADLILNSNPAASKESYRRAGSEARLLLGSRYVLLRREFRSLRIERFFPEEGTKVLVSLGGSDPENLAPRIVEALRPIASVQLTVVAGAAYRHWTELRGLSASNVRAVFNPSTMPELMCENDIGVTAAGGTLWELLYTGCATISYARNPVQAGVVSFVAQHGAARDMGHPRDFNGAALVAAVAELVSDKSLRQRMANAGRLLVDAKGPERVAAAIRGVG